MLKYKKGNIRSNVFTIFVPDQTKGVFKEEFDERLSSKTWGARRRIAI